jgi:hypothetical protein
MVENWTLEDKRGYALEYFKLHAGQRMALFNYFVLISALLTAGLAATLRRDCDCPIFGLFLSLGIIVISFVFWKLNQRVAYFIKHAESALKTLERSSLSEDTNGQELSLSCSEEMKTKKVKENTYRWNPFSWHMSYSECFSIVYVLFAVVGLIGAVVTIQKMVIEGTYAG